jgi:arsenite oxidase large subunit
MTYIADKGWTDKAFIDASTTNFDQMKAANKPKPPFGFV